jgi:hypothetical protein
LERPGKAVFRTVGDGEQNKRHPVTGVACLRFEGTLVGDVALLKDVSQSNYRGHSLARKIL